MAATVLLEKCFMSTSEGGAQLFGVKIDSIVVEKISASANAKARLGEYRPFSMEIIVWRDTPADRAKSS
jgi:hypothetical protein